MGGERRYHGEGMLWGGGSETETANVRRQVWHCCDFRDSRREYEAGGDGYVSEIVLMS